MGTANQKKPLNKKGQLFYNDLIKMKIGTKVIRHFHHHTDERPLVFGGLTDKDTGLGRLWRMKVKGLPDDESHFLADMGCLPYKTGWNPY